jgi:hypothetical protein
MVKSFGSLGHGGNAAGGVSQWDVGMTGIVPASGVSITYADVSSAASYASASDVLANTTP